MSLFSGPRGTGRVSPSIPVAKRNERTKPVTSLPTPDGKSVHDIQVFEPHRGKNDRTSCSGGLYNQLTGFLIRKSGTLLDFAIGLSTLTCGNISLPVASRNLLGGENEY